MSIPLSADAILREFAIIFRGKKYMAFLIYYEGMVTSTRIDDFIMQSLHLIPPKGDDDLKTTISEPQIKQFIFSFPFFYKFLVVKNKKPPLYKQQKTTIIIAY
mgnify:CR=1 FL=1